MFNALNYAILKTQLQQIAEKGDTGSSAYDVAVAGGYMGTEAEFNAAIASPRFITAPVDGKYAEAHFGDILTAASNSIISTFWLTYTKEMENMYGQIIESVTINMLAAEKTLTFRGYDNEIDCFPETMKGLRDDAFAADLGGYDLFRIISSTAGVSTYLLDGTDARVQILTNHPIICPKAIGVCKSGDNGLFKYNTSYTNVPGKIWFTHRNISLDFIHNQPQHLAVNFGYTKVKKINIGVVSNPGGGLREGLPLTVKLPLSGKRISFLADSITTFSGHNPAGYAVWYPSGDISSVEKTWWKQLIDETGLTLVSNASWSGSTVTGNSADVSSGSAGCSTKRISDLAFGRKTPDIVICYIGINDFGLSNTRDVGAWDGTAAVPAEGTVIIFSDAYALMIKKVMAAYPGCVVYCCTLPETNRSDYDQQDASAYPVKNSDGVVLEAYNTAIRKVSGALGARVIELHDCGINYWNLSAYTLDGIHPNAAGAKLIKDKVKSVLLKDYFSCLV